MRGMRQLFSQSNLEHSWTKTNCLALRQSVGERTEACEKSVSPTEESLHRGIVSAIRFLVRDCRQKMTNTLQETLASCVTEEKENSSLCSINSRLGELDREMDRLLLIEENEVVDLRIKQISEEILQLKQMKKRAAFFTEQNRTAAKENQWN